MEVTLAIILSVSLFIPLLIIFLHQKSFKSTTPPGPPRVPFIGNLLQLDTSCLHEYLWKLSAERYGPLMSLKLGSIPVIVVSSARLAEEVMNNQDLAFCKRPSMLGQQRLTYNGLDVAFGAYNQEWREKRKLFSVHLLSVKRTLQFRPIRQHEASRMVNIIRKDAGKIINLSEIIVLITSSIICRVAFGKQIEEDDGDHVQEKRRFDDMLHDIQAMFVGFFFSDYFPSIGWMDNLTGMRSRLEKTFQKLDLYFQSLIDEHLDPERPASMDNDIIDIILQLQRDGSTSFQITMDHIKALVMDVFVGATETSACAVIWTMTALMMNPGIMAKVQTEIREAMGCKEMVEEDDIDELPYFKAAVKESVRLYPVTPLILRESQEKCNLGGYEIPPKTTVYVNVWGIGRDPEVWENPDDFSPARFLDQSEADKHEIYQFGSGRRSCPGSLVGLSTVHLLVSNLLHSFNWKLPSGMKTDDIDTASLPGLVMSKKIDLRLVARNP